MKKVEVVMVAACVAIWLGVVAVSVAAAKVCSREPVVVEKPEITVKFESGVELVIERKEDSYDYSLALMTFSAMKKAELDMDWNDALYVSETITRKAKEAGLDPRDALILCHVESDFKYDANNKRGGAVGLCQITKPCLKEYNDWTGNSYTMNDMWEIDKNLTVGFWYMKHLMTVYAKRGYPIHTIRDAYIAYNVGPSYYKNAKNREMLEAGKHYNKYTKRWEVYNANKRFDRIAQSYSFEALDYSFM